MAGVPEPELSIGIHGDPMDQGRPRQPLVEAHIDGGERSEAPLQIERRLDFSMQPESEPEPEPEPEPKLGIHPVEVRKRITEIYAVYNPRKLDGDIDVLLAPCETY